jgi:hypothetical protein
MAAAGAAGVGMLALTQTAEAKVVYTPTNVVVNSSVAIDLNHDGIADFAVTIGAAYGGHGLWLTVSPKVTGNAIRENGGAAAGFLGVPVGPGERFATNTWYGEGLFMAGVFEYSFTSFTGPWANAKNRYLGLKLQINGQTHYGWARLSVGNFLISGLVLLTGYAYETIPNKTIIEGHTSGPEKAGNIAPADLLAPATQPASLGLLARGADVLSIWRREDDSAIR